MSLEPTIFRAYDIRGVYPTTLHEDAAFKIGRAFAKRLTRELGFANEIVIGYDGRMSSPALHGALADGILSAGIACTSVGLVPTPALYYAACTRHAAGAVMITGSHNPPDHNGFKMMSGTRPFYGDDLQALACDIADDQTKAQPSSLTLNSTDIIEAYITNLLSAAPKKSDLKIAWDAGNGATGEVLERLVARLPGTHHTLFTAIDGTFPNHHPDPSDAHNLEDLIAEVKSRKLDFGIAFDGDGDRIGVVDADGSVLYGDELLAVFAGDVLTQIKGARVLCDVKSSQQVLDHISACGGTPVLWKTGHAHMKTKLYDERIPLAGEVSGHLFFADKYFGFDDALYAAVRLVELLSRSGETLAAIRARLPKYVSTPELRIESTEEKKFGIVEKIAAQARANGWDFTDIDGVRVNRDGGWWLIRASNTQAMLVARAEGKDEATRDRLHAELTQAIAETADRA